MINVLGIDIGGSGIKGAPVNLAKGEFATDRFRIETPAKSTPRRVADVVAQIVEHFEDQIDPHAAIGITVPGAVVHGVVMTMAHMDPSWIGVNAEQLFMKRLGRPVVALNDADAAGLAEVQYGAAKGRRGLVIMTTLGTGIGTALIQDGILVPNTELGHMEVDGHDAETRASAGVFEANDWTYEKWAKKLQRYYEALDALFWPDLFVVGGGISKKHKKFLPLLDLRPEIVPAKLLNTAGIVGAAWMAKKRSA